MPPTYHAMLIHITCNYLHVLLELEKKKGFKSYWALAGTAAPRAQKEHNVLRTGNGIGPKEKLDLDSPFFFLFSGVGSKQLVKLLVLVKQNTTSQVN